MKEQIVILNREKSFGTIDGVIVRAVEITKLINKHLKSGTAKKLCDTDEVLMYKLKSQ